MQTEQSKTSNWKTQGRAWHSVTPPSAMPGMELRIPALTELIRNDAVPDRLRSLALKSAAHAFGLRGVVGEVLAEANTAKTEDAALLADDSALRQAIDDVAEIQKRLIVESVRVDGVLLTLEDIEDPEFPAPDAEWLGGVMLREIEYDARGVRLGIEPLEPWGRFREHHGCGPDCSACAALQDEFSSVDLGDV